jgi:alcohol dehydrogenase YqhD (iron-dependent ADH family)
MPKFSEFSFFMYTDILSGPGTEREAGRMVKKHGGTKVLFVYGSGSIKKNGLYDRITAALNEAGVPFAELGGVQANPHRSLVEKGIALAVKEGCDFLLAAGGGSVLDTAKAIGLALANKGEYWAFFRGAAKTDKMAGLGAIPTIAAAGSETSHSCVILDDIPEGSPACCADTLGRKMSVPFNCIRPTFAILDPELTYSVPAYQTAAGATDILSHTFMRWFYRGNPVSHIADVFAAGLMRNVVRFAPAALAKPDDYEARAELLLSASMSHCDITCYGRSGLNGGEHGAEVVNGGNVEAHAHKTGEPPGVFDVESGDFSPGAEVREGFGNSGGG